MIKILNRALILKQRRVRRVRCIMPRIFRTKNLKKVNLLKKIIRIKCQIMT